MIEDVIKSIKMFMLFAVLIGGGYNGLLHLLGYFIFPYQAQGSLIIDKDNNIKGSILLGQHFRTTQLFHSRLQHNSNFELYTPIYDEERIFDLKNNMRYLKNDYSSEVPMEIIAFSASNLDPYISVRAAYAQINRISQATNIPSHQLVILIDELKEYNLQPFFIIDKVNVVKLNLALKKLIGR